MGDGTDKLLLQHVHSTEEQEGTRYRWTRENPTLTVHRFAIAHPAYLTLDLGGLPPQIPEPRMVHANMHGTPWVSLPVTSQPRHYTLLLPPTALRNGNLSIHFSTEATRVPPDERKLGVRIDSFTLGWVSTSNATPPWSTIVVQWLIIIIIIHLVTHFKPPKWSIITLAGGLIVALALLHAYHLPVAAMWQARFLVACITLLLIFHATLPLFQRLFPSTSSRTDMQLLWMLTLIAFTIRMGFILYPPFDSHDWYIHRKRIIDFLTGTFLIYDHPAEFSRKLTIVPPAPYLLYAPLTLLANNVIVAMQAVYAFVDSMSILCMGLFAHALGGNKRTTTFALLMVALFPLNFTALWWGFGPQVIGQTLIILLATLIVYSPPPQRMPWVVVGFVFSVLLLSHIGAGILGGFWLAGYTVLLLALQRIQPRHWRTWAILIILCGILVTSLFYIEVLALQMRGLATNSRLGWDEGDVFRVKWTLASLYSSFKPIGVALPVASIILLLHTVRATHRWLISAWVISALIFFIVDVAFGLQVRYAYFLVPVIATGFGIICTQFSKRHRVGTFVAWTMIALIGFAGLHLWYEGIFEGIKPSLRGLTH